MKHALIIAAITAAFAANANAHGCSGPGACQTIGHNPQGGTATSTAAGGDQWQTQRQESAQSNRQQIDGGNSTNTLSPTTAANISDNRTYSSRYIDLVPVRTAQPVVVTPAAEVSRYAGQCGPRMQIKARDVQGRFFGAFTDSTFNAGEDHVLLAAHEPYRIIEVMPGFKQAIGHRPIETTAVVTVSSSRSIGLAGGNGSGGGSATSGGGGAVQRLVTTVRLEECVAFELRDKPPAPAPKPIKRRPVRKVPPACSNTCPAPAPVTTTTVTTVTTTK